MLAKINSAAVHGIDGYLVTVEVDISYGDPKFFVIGLPDTAVKEARDRVQPAIRNSGFDFPYKRMTINLAPADIKKEGASFDLPMAVGILAASESVELKHLQDWCLIGELALDGTLRPVKGILPAAIAVREKKIKGIILPSINENEAQVVQGIKVFGAKNLKEVIQFLNQESLDHVPNVSSQPVIFHPEKTELDFSDVKGQQFAKRALEIACAGGHNVLMVGPPGAGKTMLSKRMTSILPPLTFEEAIETTKIHSVAGLVQRDLGLVKSRPFRSPHHTISDIALIGGGQTPKPGEVSLAHNGVLFLDELPEFHRNVLEVLRQPLEGREVMIARAKETLTFPSNFMLIAAMNPCPCGFSGHPAKECVCTPYQIQKYMAKISGPLLDRIDIHLEVPALQLEEVLSDGKVSEDSTKIRQRVITAREIQKERFKGTRTFSNAQMHSRQTKKCCILDQEAQTMIRTAIERLHFSARAYDRILKVALTIADLSESDAILGEHMAEAVQYRSLDKLMN